MNNVLISHTIEDSQLNILKSTFPELNFRIAPSDKQTKEDILWADAILGNPKRDHLYENDRLSLVSLNSAGSTEYCTPGVLRDNTVLTNATGAYGIIISEWMIGMLLSIINHLPDYREQQKASHWEKLKFTRTHIYGAKILIIGTGNIGTEFAKRVKAMGAYTIGVRRASTNKNEYFDEMHLVSELDELLPQADIIAMSLPGTDATTHIMTRERLYSLKESAVLLNVGRGSAIDFKALYDALSEKKFMACGVDVTEPEPLTAEDPIWKLDNFFVTPHISGGLNSPISAGFVFDSYIHNLNAFLGKGEYMNVVNKTTGYKISAK